MICVGRVFRLLKSGYQQIINMAILPPRNDVNGGECLAPWH